jgi:hypothetical protein
VPTNENVRSRNRVLLYAPAADVMRWIEAELVDQPIALQIARTVPEIVRVLVEDPPPRPQLLVADVDAIAPADVLGLHDIRDRGWFGSVIALGEVSAPLRASLNIERVLARPLERYALRDAVIEVGLGNKTTRMPRVRR